MRIEARMGHHISETAKEAVDLVAGGAPSVSFDFNEIRLVVMSGMTAADVCAEYDRQCEERHAAYVATPEYQERCRQAQEEGVRRAAVLDEILAIAPSAMTLRDPEGWAKARAANTDSYGNGIMTYAERWARIMEAMIVRDVTTVAGCAKEASHLADSEGITGFMYGAAVSTLSAVWVYGEALRRWHNLDTQLGGEGERANESGGVLNPAILTLGG